jgi:cytochrome P450 monooxygenase
MEPQYVSFNLDLINQQGARYHNFLELTTRPFNKLRKIYKVVRLGKISICVFDSEVVRVIPFTYFEDFGTQPIRYEGGEGFFSNGMLVAERL